VAGRLVARQRAQSARLAALAAQLRREQARAAETAVAEERARIARELHDIVGHDVSVIALQADAAAASLQSAPERAHAPIAAIRASATDALAEMRRVLGALRADGDAELGPQPGVDDLPALVARSRAAGTPVELVVTGTPHPVGQMVELALFRLAQEALTNAHKHAPGAPVRLTLAWRDRAVELRVTDEGPGPSANGSGGHGLLGMHERVRLLGGELSTGPATGGGFEVAATLPLTTAAPAA
jgi:signal transduction histidine kinase